MSLHLSFWAHDQKGTQAAFQIRHGFAWQPRELSPGFTLSGARGLHNDMDSGGDLSKVWQLFISLWPALAALFISHSYSFFKNFLGRQEYKGRTVSDQMGEPYSRIIFMHLVLIFGGGLTMILGEPAPVLLIVMGLKIYFDLKAHLKQRVGPMRSG